MALGCAAVTVPPAFAADGHWEVIDKYCVTCHNATDWAGSIAMDTLDRDNVAGDAETWESAIKRMRGRLMPPPGEPRPDAARLDAFVGWMEGRIDSAAHSSPGYVQLHRLNRREYANAIQYLVGLTIEPATLLPQDDLSDGFDSVANVLQVSPSFLDQYLAAARTVAVQAVGNPSARVVGTPYANQDAGPQQTHIEGLPLGTRGGMAIDHIFPADGEYELNVNDMARALWVEGMEFENTLVALVDGRIVYEVRLGGEEDQKAIDQKGDPPVDAINKRLKNIRFRATAGQHRVAVTFRSRSFAENDARLAALVPGGGEDRVLRVNSVEIRGPFKAEGVSNSPSRQRIFTCYPKSAGEEESCAREIVDTLARRAFRRPLTDADRSTLMKAYFSSREGKTFDEGIRGAITRILASPEFLYRAEPAPATASPGATYRLNDLELASRLSFFLWSNLPDDELLEVATRGELGNDTVLDQQVRRMLKDPRSASLARSFAFQWFGMSKLADIEPDPAVFPYAAVNRDVNGDLRGEMREELALFVDSVFRDNRSVVDLLTGNWTYLNERLAIHYGINDVKGDQFRRVELKDTVRYGLLGKAGVLMVTSYPNRTSPVLRGAWILENISGTPPTPPPPGVEALKDAPAGAKVLTLREQMARHSQVKSCHSCHGIMDPLGFALENFDGTGRFREKDRLAETVVDASGDLPDGSKVNGPDDLRRAIASRPDQFVQTLVQKLMIYGIGRSIEYHDMPTVRGIVRDSARDDYRFVSLITHIVKSDPFRMKQLPAEPAAPAVVPKQAAVIR
jgi:mono/diheme cytochrome c family protein